jgi:protein ImuA
MNHLRCQANAMNTARPDAANQNLPPDAPAEGNKSTCLNDLKARIARLEQASGSLGPPAPDRVVRLNLPAIDLHLPWGGLPRGALHEVAGEGADREQAAAAAGFTALWLARLQAKGPVLWIVRAASRSALDLYAHGLRQLALDPDRLILVAARKDDEALWTMEEGLKARALGGVLGEVGRLDLTASRRLQLAAEASGVTAFVLRRWRLMQQAEREAAQPIAAVTRWRIAALPSAGEMRWKVELARCRGGRPNTWMIQSGMMETADGSDRLHAAPLSGDLAEVLGHGSPAADAHVDRIDIDRDRRAG